MTGKEIKRLRLQSKLTQPQFCKVLKMDSVSTLSRWERGVHKPSRLWNERLEKLLKTGRVD